MRTVYVHASGPDEWFVRCEDGAAILSYARQNLGHDPKPVEDCPGWVSIVLHGYDSLIHFLFEVVDGAVFRNGATSFWIEVAGPMRAEREELLRFAKRHPDLVRVLTDGEDT